MKKLLKLMLILGALLLGTAALAEPMVSANGYTAYLGENNHLYLQDPLGAEKVLRHPIANLISMTDTHLYAVAQDGRLFGIQLDGSQTLVLTDTPTEADIAAVSAAPTFDLTENILYIVKPGGGKLLLSSTALAAAANDDRLFYIEQALDGSVSLKAVMLDGITMVSSLEPIPTTIGPGVDAPLSMTATADALAIVGADRSVTVVSLIDNRHQLYPATSAVTMKAVSIGTRLFRYTQTAEGAWLTEADAGLPALVAVDAPARGTATATPTATPTVTLRPTATPTPRITATPRPTPTATPEEEYPRLDYGDKGTNVRNMQRRLKKLGYPVGSVDGTWGKNTQLAVNLFQCAIGYSERSYASSSMQEKLFSRNAPPYDPYAPLREGDKGTDVKIMQKALFDLGYLGTDEEEEVDGVYGPITTAAVLAFQQAVGDDVLLPTGVADADTLMILYSDAAPRNPALNQPTDPNYPEFITPGPGNPVNPNPPQPDAPADPEPIVPSEPVEPDPEDPDPIVPSEPVEPDPDYPEFITPETPSEPDQPVSTTTDLVVSITPDA